jgi:hypothetical protein
METELAIYKLSELEGALKDDNIFKEPLQTAIAALEKQIPKPPEYKVVEKYKALGKNYWCTCGVMFVDFERNGTTFCGACGQRLK